MKGLRVVLLVAVLPLAAGRVVVTYQDASLTHYPARAVVAEELRAGRLPFVHPGASCGQPLAGNPNFGVFFPDTLLAILLPLPVAFGLRFALALVLAFVGARRWGRTEGVPREAAEIAALAFVLSGVFLSTFRFFNSGLALATAPWVLAAAAKLARRAAEGSGPPPRRAAAELGLWGGLELLAGEPVIALLTFGVAFLRAFALALAAGAPTRLAKVATALGRGAVLAGLIGAPQIAATAQILGDSSRERKPIPFVTAAGTSVHPVRLIEQVVPFPYGRPDLRGPEGFHGHRFFDNHVPYLWTLHVGLVVLGLLTLHGSLRERGEALFAAIALGAVMLSLGKYLPGAKALYPWLSLGGRIRFPVKWWYVVALALVPVVGWAASRWLNGESASPARRFGLATLGLGSALALLAVPPLTELAAAGPIVSLALIGILFLPGRRRPAALAWALVTSLTLCALPQLQALLDAPPAAPPRISAGRIYSRVEAEAHPRSLPDASEGGLVRAFFRRASPELWALTATREGMGYAFDLDPDGAYADDDRAVRKALDPLPWAERAPELRVAGVTTVVADEALPPPYREANVLNAALGVRAYTLEDASPSVRVATRVHRAPDALAAMAIHRADDFDLRTDVVLEGPAASASAPAASGRVLHRLETAATLGAEVEAESDAVVVWSRTYFSAWQARVDGAAVTPLRAEGHLVGIPVPAGRHRVDIGWRPGPVHAGLGLCLLGLATAAALRRE